MLKQTMVDLMLEKYGLPKWMQGYVYNYVKGSNLVSIKKAASFVNFGRKKGMVRKDGILLPNGTSFTKDQVLHLVSLFLYGEERIAEISSCWAVESDSNERRAHFYEMAKLESKRARAIRSAVEGIGGKPTPPTKELVAVFDYVEDMKTWEERLITKKILLNYAFAKPFGFVFYKVFYPVSPEFMRSFGTAFNERTQVEKHGEAEACAALQDGRVSNNRVMQMSEELLILIAKTVNAEMKNARKAKIEREAMLLRDISIAYPLHRLNELGIDMDVGHELEKIKRAARKKQ